MWASASSYKRKLSRSLFFQMVWVLAKNDLHGMFAWLLRARSRAIK